MQDQSSSGRVFASSAMIVAIGCSLAWPLGRARAADNPAVTPAVLQKAARLQTGEILELVTTFLPAPGIEIMKSKGLRVWSMQQGPELIRTYVSKPGDDQ